ncbi:hypothetical protein [Actinoplanes sp. NPDC051494]|uniref:hypothetical protein n=1 Tax=Actinoplanes sp. NPDC051494 TaxID=3363907 RepID=UPI0037BA1B45
MTGNARGTVDRFNLVVTTFKNIREIAIAGTVLTAGAIAAFVAWSPPVWITVPISVILGLGAGIAVGAKIVGRRARHAMAQTGFKVIEYSMAYRISGTDVYMHECEREFLLEATHNGASLFVFEYGWSGQGTIRTDVPEQQVYRLLDDSRSAHKLDRRTIVGMNRSYSPGETVSVTVIQYLRDTEKQFGHFLSKIVKQPMRKATLSIEFPPNLAVQPAPTAFIKRWNSAASWVNEQDVSSKLQQVGHVHRLEVDKPPTGKMLSVQWPWREKY